MDANEQNRPPGPDAAEVSPARPARPAREWLVARLVVFVLTFFFLAASLLGLVQNFTSEANFWLMLAAALGATWFCVAVVEKGNWDAGLRLKSSPGEILRGVVMATVIIGLVDALILATTGFHHPPGKGIPWRQLGLVFIPAAIQEEVLLRGYFFQRLAKRNAIFAVLFCSIVFALLHAGNTAVGLIALTNIFLAGVLLSLAFLEKWSLWYPIGIHVWWNISSGPILGHEVSGFAVDPTLLSQIDPGPDFLTGGRFGLEASIFCTLVEAATVGLLLWRMHRRRKGMDAIDRFF